MACSFVPASLFQRFANDQSLSDTVRRDAQTTADAIKRTLAAGAEAAQPHTVVRIRYDEVPTGFPDFSCKIWGMANVSFEDIDPLTGAPTSTSYKPLPGIFYASSHDAPYTADPDVMTCMENLRTVHSFYKTVFGRNSIDGKGLQLEASIHYQIRYGNALWEPNSHQMVIGDGDGNTRFGRFAGFFKHGSMVDSLDVIAHEVTHGVTQFTADLEYLGESGALNESISDVFGSMVVQWKHNQQVQDADWLMGNNILYTGSESLAEIKASGATSLRSLKNPSAVTNLMPQPDTPHSELFHHWNGREDDEDHGGVHQNSGIPNLAFYKAAMALGGHSWERAGRVWYATLTDKDLSKKAQFVDFARLTIKNAGLLFPTQPEVAEQVKKAWADVQVLV